MLLSLDLIRNKYSDILKKLSNEEVINNMELLRKYAKEEAKLKEIITLHDEYEKLTKDEEGLHFLRDDK